MKGGGGGGRVTSVVGEQAGGRMRDSTPFRLFLSLCRLIILYPSVGPFFFLSSLLLWHLFPPSRVNNRMADDRTQARSTGVCLHPEDLPAVTSPRYVDPSRVDLTRISSIARPLIHCLSLDFRQKLGNRPVNLPREM